MLLSHQFPFIGKRYTVVEISILMDIPLRTLRRRMSALGLSVSGEYSQIADEDLDALVLQITTENPLLGERLILHRLGAMGHMVRRRTLRQSLRLVAGRRNLPPPIARRRYSVRAPLSLIHIDGNHKLIR